MDGGKLCIFYISIRFSSNKNDSSHFETNVHQSKLINYFSVIAYPIETTKTIIIMCTSKSVH